MSKQIEVSDKTWERLILINAKIGVRLEVIEAAALQWVEDQITYYETEYETGERLFEELVQQGCIEVSQSVSERDLGSSWSDYDNVSKYESEHFGELALAYGLARGLLVYRADGAFDYFPRDP